MTERTKRQPYSVILKNNNIILTSFVNYVNKNLNYITIKYFNNFIIFQYLFNNLNNVLLTNLLKSLVYVLLYNINNSLIPVTNINNNYKNYINKKVITYSYVVKTLTIFLHKNKLTKLLYFTLKLITNNYTNPTNSLLITTNNLVVTSSFQFFVFLNLFYFKVRNY